MLDDINTTTIWLVANLLVVLFSLAMIRYYFVRHYKYLLSNQEKEIEKLNQKLENSSVELEYLSNHDPLTKLYNRNYFNQQIENDLRAKKNKDASICLVVIDVDHFKEINEAYNHATGDSVLAELSQLLSNCTREKDIVARWGGEEFVIWCNQSAIGEAKKLCQRITSAIQNFHFSGVDKITCCFGIAQLLGNEHMLQCFERANEALYSAKQKGRNQICVSEPSLV